MSNARRRTPQAEQPYTRSQDMVAPSFTYNGNPGASDVSAVRFEIQDTNASAPLLQDGEIAWAILNETSTAAATPAVLTGGPLFASAARCCEVLARQLAMQADTVEGALSQTYSAAAKNYAEQAVALRLKASGYHAPYAGGQSWSEKEGFQQDPDTVDPTFSRGEFNNPYAGSWSDGNSYGDDPDLSALPPSQ
jgi:hypothetical protein